MAQYEQKTEIQYNRNKFSFKEKKLTKIPLSKRKILYEATLLLDWDTKSDYGKRPSCCGENAHFTQGTEMFGDK